MNRPNLLFLYTDEQRFDTLAAYGNTTIDMPNLNALADQSTVFDKAYVTQPVCTPSRSSLLTGLYPHNNNMVTNNLTLAEQFRCLPEMLPEGEYVSGHFGKWHLGNEIFRQHGFDRWVSVEDGYCFFFTEDHNQGDRSDYYHYLRTLGFMPTNRQMNLFPRDFAHRLPENISKPAYLADHATQFIRENARDGQPFCCYVNFLEPHMPFYSCRDEQYDPAAVDLPENFGHELDESYRLKSRAVAARMKADGFDGVELKTEEDWRGMIAKYWGMCSLVDTHVGTILQTLKDTGQWDNTIIVFTSDHGDMMGSHGLLAKGVMFEESTRVPMLVRLPGQDTLHHIEAPVSQIDLVPTLLEAMGVDVPEGLDGTSRLDAVAGGADPTDDVFIQWNTDSGDSGDRPSSGLPHYCEGMCSLEEYDASLNDRIRTIVTDDGWKLCCSPIGEHELFDLNVDPYETKNLSGDPAQVDRMNDLLGRIKAWQQACGDTVELPASIAV